MSSCGYEQDLLNAAAPIVSAATETLRLATTAELRRHDVVTGSYIVMFKSAELPRTFRSFKSEFGHHFSLLADAHLGDPRVADLDYIDHIDLAGLADPDSADYDGDFDAPPALHLAFDGKRTPPAMGTMATVKFRSAADAASVLVEWEKAGAIWYAEPNGISRLSEPGGVFAEIKANYEKPQKIWWHEKIKLHEAFGAMDSRDTSPGKHPVDKDLAAPVIAVLDSGLDVLHESIAGNLWDVKEAIGQSGCPNDKHGCDTTKASKGVFGDGNVTPYNTAPGSRNCKPSPSKPAEPDGNCVHGTHVAGIIAAKYDGAVGGACPYCLIMPVKIIADVEGGGGGATDAAILNGLKYVTKFVANQKAIVRVVNSSFGKYSRSRSMTVLVSVLTRSPNEVLVVGAASNEDSMARAYPAALEKAIAVSAVTAELRKAPYSNYGPWVDIAAPGGSKEQAIMSLQPGGLFIGKVGTSMATPVVAAVAGLVLTIDPKETFRGLRNRIILGADPAFYRPEIADGFNYRFYYVKPLDEDSKRPLLGSGVVDAKCAIENCKQASGITGVKSSRVTSGCSVVGPPREKKSAAWLGLGIFALPIMMAARRRRSALFAKL